MKRNLLVALICFAVIAPGIAKEAGPETDAAIRQALIDQSIASYSGRCPCPYNTMKNGHSCGGRSAYSRPGGRSPLCYPKDISDEMVRSYRAKQ